MPPPMVIVAGHVRARIAVPALSVCSAAGASAVLVPVEVASLSPSLLLLSSVVPVGLLPVVRVGEDVSSPDAVESSSLALLPLPLPLPLLPVGAGRRCPSLVVIGMESPLITTDPEGESEMVLPETVMGAPPAVMGVLSIRKEEGGEVDESLSLSLLLLSLLLLSLLLSSSSLSPLPGPLVSVESGD